MVRERAAKRPKASTSGADIDAGAERLERKILAACDSVGEFIAYWGFKSIHGRLWTYLALHRQPLTQVNLARALGVSRALVSMSIDELVGYGLVRPVSDRRNAPYEAVLDVWSTVADVLRSREWMLVESARLALEAALDEVKAEESRGRTTPYDATRLRMLLGMTELAQVFLRLLMRLRSGETLDRLGGWADKAAGFFGRWMRPGGR